MYNIGDKAFHKEKNKKGIITEIYDNSEILIFRYRAGENIWISLPVNFNDDNLILIRKEKINRLIKDL